MDFQVLAAGNQPDFRTISDFRKIHHKALEGFFQQVLRLVLKAGAMKLGRGAIDGSMEPMVGIIKKQSGKKPKKG